MQLKPASIAAALFIAAPAAGDSKVKIAVLDLQARGVDASLVQSAGTLIASEITWPQPLSQAAPKWASRGASS